MSSTWVIHFHHVFNLLEKAKVSAGAGFKRFLAKVGSSPISHPPRAGFLFWGG
jgi:hypothetical protein